MTQSRGTYLFFYPGRLVPRMLRSLRRSPQIIYGFQLLPAAAARNLFRSCTFVYDVQTITLIYLVCIAGDLRAKSVPIKQASQFIKTGRVCDSQLVVFVGFNPTGPAAA